MGDKLTTCREGAYMLHCVIVFGGGTELWQRSMMPHAGAQDILQEIDKVRNLFSDRMFSAKTIIESK